MNGEELKENPLCLNTLGLLEQNILFKALRSVLFGSKHSTWKISQFFWGGEGGLKFSLMDSPLRRQHIQVLPLKTEHTLDQICC